MPEHLTLPPIDCFPSEIGGEGGKGVRKSENNYVAQTGPNSGDRKGAGAKPGNRNALKTGLHTAEMRKRRKAVRAQVVRVKTAIALVDAHLAGRMSREELGTVLSGLIKQPRPEFPK